MDFFPYNNFWRLKGQERVSSRCSVIASVIVVLALLALMIERIVLVAKKQTVKTSSQTVISSFPPNSTLTTYQNVDGQDPFMIAIQWVSKYGFIGTPFFDAAIVASKTTFFSLQKCTPEHFSKFPGFTAISNTSLWMCLPLNKTISLYGSQFQSSQFSTIRLRTICTDCVFSSFGALLNIYTLSAVINPSNGSDYSQYSIEQAGIPITQYRGKGFIYEMNENVVTTDNSLLPWEVLKTQRSWKPGQIRATYSDPLLNNISITQVFIQRSTQTVEYKRSYYKIQDALSYIGGIFQVLLGAFFFMAIVGRMFFEFYLAKKYFRTQILSYFGASDFVQQLIYQIMSKLSYRPKWEIAERRQKIRETVNNMMDVAYLQKRINLLESSLAVLLQKHQLSGLFLCQKTTEEEANAIYRAHNFKDRLIRYLSLRSVQKKAANYVQKQWKNDKSGQSMKNFASFELDDEVKENRQVRNKSSLSKQQNIQKTPDKKDKIDGKTQYLSSVRQSRKKVQNLQNIDKSKEEVKRKTKAEDPIIIDNQIKVERQKNIAQQSNGSEELRSRGQQEEKLKEAYYSLDPNEVYELNTPQLEEWIHNDFRKLAYESQVFRGDEMSKKIYNSMEGWLRNILKDIVDQREAFQSSKLYRHKSGSS